MNNKYCGSHVK